MNKFTPRIVRDDQPTLLEAAVHELLSALDRLSGLLRELAELAQAKLAGIRRADSNALQDCAARESAALEAVVTAEKERNAALAELAHALRAPELQKACLMTIADQLPEPFSSQIRAKTSGLRQNAEILQKKNRLAGEVARNLQRHLRSVMNELAGGGQPSVYGPAGTLSQTASRFCLDAVG